MMKEMLSKIMKRAWQIKREDSRNIFSLCLQMAWTEVKSPISAQLIRAGYEMEQVNDIIYITVNGVKREVPEGSTREIVFTAANNLKVSCIEIYKDWYKSHEYQTESKKFKVAFEKEQEKQAKELKQKFSEHAKKLASMKKTNELVKINSSKRDYRVGKRYSVKGVVVEVTSVIEDVDYRDVMQIEGYICK